MRVRTSKYLNNAIEQDHRRIKQRLRPMLGLKSFRTAAFVIKGLELAEKIKKGQFKIGKTRREHGDNSGDLVSRPGCVVGFRPSDTASLTGFGSTLGFAPEPAQACDLQIGAAQPHRLDWVFM